MADQFPESDLAETNDGDEKLEKENKKPKKVKKVKKKKAKGQNSNSFDEDGELSELLDSALEDFTTCDKNDIESNSKQDDCAKPVPPSSLWDEEFMKQAAEKFQQSFPSGFGAGDTPITAEQLGQNLQSLAEAMTQMGAGETSPDMEFTNFFAQTLKQFSETPDPSRRPTSEDEFRSMMANLNNCLDSSEFSEIFPLIFSMMQNLLSKDVLYADIKETTEKYPRWLEENKTKLPSHEYDRHEKKLEILRQVCSELETESSDDSEDVKKARCDRVLLLMLQVQELGPMPSEIAGDLSPMLGLDNQGLLPPNLSPNQCSIV